MRGQKRFTPNNASRSRNGSNNKSKSPSRPVFEQGGVMLYLTWVEESFQAGLSEDGIIQSYFITEKEKMMSKEQKRKFVEDTIRKMVREQRNRDRKTLNMVEHISEEKYGVPLKLDTTWTKYTDLGYPLMVDANILVTKDRQEWTDFFQNFFKNDLIKVPNQNQSENYNNNNNNQIEEEDIVYYTKEQLMAITNDEKGAQILDRLQRRIKGRLIIHKDYMFPDGAPWIVQREGFTHHILLGMDTTPNKLVFFRKELYQMLGDYYKRKDKKRIYLVKYSFKEYLVKLQQVGEYVENIRQTQRVEQDRGRNQQNNSLQQSRETVVIQEEQQVVPNQVEAQQRLQLSNLQKERDQAWNEIIEEIYLQQQQEVRFSSSAREVEAGSPESFERDKTTRQKKKEKSKTVQKEDNRQRSDRKKEPEREEGQQERRQVEIPDEKYLELQPFMLEKPKIDNDTTNPDGTNKVQFEALEYKEMERAHLIGIKRGYAQTNNNAYMFENMSLNSGALILKNPISERWRGCLMDFSQILGEFVYKQHPTREQLKEDMALGWFVIRVIANKKTQISVDQRLQNNITYLRDRYGTKMWQLWIMNKEEEIERKLQDQNFVKQLGIRVVSAAEYIQYVKGIQEIMAEKTEMGQLFLDRNAFFNMSNITIGARRWKGNVDFDFKFLTWEIKTREKTKGSVIIVDKSIWCAEKFLETFRLYPWTNIVARPRYDWAIADQITNEIFPSILEAATLSMREQNGEVRHMQKAVTYMKKYLETWTIEDQELTSKYANTQHYNGK